MRKELRVTAVGHSTVLLEGDGAAVLTDPVLRDRVALLKRKSPPGLAPADLPPLSAAVVSHGHYDHLDVPSLALLPPEVPLVTPPRATALVPGLAGRRIIPLAHWESVTAGGAEIISVPARHFGGRYLVDSAFRPAAGYVIRLGGATVYFAGDTAWQGAFKEIGRRFRPDVALLPIGAYRPQWFMRYSHIGPADAVRAFLDLNARYFIPIHFGAYKLSLEPVEEPPRRLLEFVQKAGIEGRVALLAPGQSWSLPS